MASVFTSNDLEHIIEVPRGFFKRPSGFSLDIGGSCAKLAYYDVSDPDNGAEVTKIHLVLFKEDETGKVCDLLVQKFSLPGNPDWADHVVYTTGIGGSQYIKIFKEKLGVTIRNINEMDCSTKAFRTLLETLDTDKFVLEKSEEAVAKGMGRLEIRKMAVEEWKKTSQMEGKEEEKPEERNSQEKYPCGLCIVGSGGALLKIEEESEGFGLISGISQAGRAFIGIGSLLTGKQSYGEIMEAAEKGTIDDLCIMTTDFVVDDGSEGIYDMVNKMPKIPVFLFGKAAGKTVGDFKPEDLARTWVYVYASQLGEFLPFMAKSGGIKQIYFSGNFFNHKLIRDDITEAIICHNLAQSDLKFDFVRYGGHYGSIGALMEDNLSEEFDVMLRLKKVATK